MIQSNMAKTPTPTRPSPVVPAKFPKNIDKKDFSSSTRLNEVSGLTYIYRITMQKMTGRSRSESMSSFTSAQRSGSEEQLLTNRASVSEIISEGDSLDDVHPILEDDERPIMMTDFGSESPPDTGLRGEEDSSDKRRWNSKNLPVFNEVSFSNGMNQTDCAMPRRRVRAVSGRSWNNCIPEYSPFPSSNSHTKIHSPQSSNGSSSGVADTASLLSSDSRLGQPPVIDLICASPDSGVVHDDFNPLSSTSHGHSVASSSHDHSPPPRKTVQSHSILVDENQNTCTSNHSTAPSVANVLDSMDTQLHFTS